MKWVVLGYVLVTLYVAMACTFWINPKDGTVGSTIYEIKLEEAQHFSLLDEE